MEKPSRTLEKRATGPRELSAYNPARSQLAIISLDRLLYDLTVRDSTYLAHSDVKGLLTDLFLVELADKVDGIFVPKSDAERQEVLGNLVLVLLVQLEPYEKCERMATLFPCESLSDEHKHRCSGLGLRRVCWFIDAPPEGYEYGTWNAKEQISTQIGLLRDYIEMTREPSEADSGVVRARIVAAVGGEGISVDRHGEAAESSRTKRGSRFHNLAKGKGNYRGPLRPLVYPGSRFNTGNLYASHIGLIDDMAITPIHSGRRTPTVISAPGRITGRLTADGVEATLPATRGSSRASLQSLSADDVATVSVFSRDTRPGSVGSNPIVSPAVKSLSSVHDLDIPPFIPPGQPRLVKMPSDPSLPSLQGNVLSYLQKLRFRLVKRRIKHLISLLFPSMQKQREEQYPIWKDLLDL